MRKLTFFAGVGMLAACSLTQAPSPDPVFALERAVLDDPGDALAWQRLGEMLEAMGDTERAQRMIKQARSLREHALMQDYSLLRKVLADKQDDMRNDEQDAKHNDMPRTELHEIGPALYELRRSVAPPAAANLEIANGNGVPGLAAAWRRALQGQQLRVVRLSNVRPFTVAVTRIEYRANAEQARLLAQRIGVSSVMEEDARPGAPDMRLILGRDKTKKPPTGVGGKLFD